MKLFFTLILTICYCYHADAQANEIQEFEQHKVKVFSSKGLVKSRGLIFSLKYPFSYSAEEHSNENILMQFADNLRYNLIYNVGVVKTPNVISKESQKIILSKSNLQTATQTVSKDAVFLDYKTNFKVNNNNASYIEYISTVAPGSKAIIRQYFIIHKNYLLTMSFSIPAFMNGTVEKTKTKFQNFKPFFEKVTNTLNIH